MRWFWFAIACRLIASWTYAHWFHPDEWCQTLEPANLIAHGFGFHSQETGLHLRNLSWPLLLAGLLKFVHWANPVSIHLRIFAVNLLCGFLDLGILWGWIQLLNQEPLTQKLSSTGKNWSLALLLLPWFTLYYSINPRGEHLSEIALWVALGCLARSFWVLGGVASIAIFAFRYPSILLTISISIYLLIQAIQTQNLRSLFRYSAGLLLGLSILGLADWIFYGRPWESFWMYLQYNVLTGSGTQAFGKQGVSTYAELFVWNWSTYKFLIPGGCILLFGSMIGFYYGIKNVRIWTLCLTVYLLGHMFVPHKEGRFIVPVETLIRWSAFVGLTYLIRYFDSISNKNWVRIKQWMGAVMSITLILDLFVFIHHLRGDFWKEKGAYRELGSHLQAHPNTCAVLTTRKIMSILLPFQDPKDFPQPATGFNVNPENYQGTKNIDLQWIEHPPLCKAGQNLLLHVRKIDPSWQTEGCFLLSSGIFKLLPQSRWPRVMEQKLGSGNWYQCPPSILSHFRSQKVVRYFSHQFGRLAALPPLGITAEQLETLGRLTSPPPPNSFLPSVVR